MAETRVRIPVAVLKQLDRAPVQMRRFAISAEVTTATSTLSRSKSSSLRLVARICRVRLSRAAVSAKVMALTAYET
jgi:hypothetical protein